MKTTITENNGVVKIAVAGELDTNTSAQFQSDVAPVKERQGVTVEMDFSELEYISSKALRVLISFQQEILAGGGTLTVTNVQPGVREIFDMTGLTASFIKD
jgi:anti-anti-sigma factor